MSDLHNSDTVSYLDNSDIRDLFLVKFIFENDTFYFADMNYEIVKGMSISLEEIRTMIDNDNPIYLKSFNDGINDIKNKNYRGCIDISNGLIESAGKDILKKTEDFVVRNFVEFYRTASTDTNSASIVCSSDTIPYGMWSIVNHLRLIRNYKGHSHGRTESFEEPDECIAVNSLLYASVVIDFMLNYQSYLMPIISMEEFIEKKK